jgi:hypothetical protein
MNDNENDKGLTTEQHAQHIAESFINGQRKQALRQWDDAMAEHCAENALLSYFPNLLTMKQLIDLMAALIIHLQRKA